MSTKKLYNLDDLNRQHGRLSIGRFLRSWRQCEGLSQKEFAKKIGISSANLCDIESGRKHVSPEKAHKIAILMGYSPTVLVRMALQDLLRDSGLKYHVEVRDRC